MRKVVIHADDVGMCEATVSCLDELMSFGLVSSASLMAPCPWFPAAADWFHAHPEVDVGVHITLNSEWRHYRWRPLSTLDRKSGLIDAEGFLPRTREELAAHARAEAVLAEATAQVEMIRRRGIEPTHLDTHMLAFETLWPREYAELGRRLGIPRRSRQLFNYIEGTPNTGSVEDRVQILMDLFSNLPEGVSCVFTHPAQDSPELRRIVPNWQYRVADCLAFSNKLLRDHIDAQGIRIVTFQDLAAQHPPRAEPNG